jgi:hypothetical protein
MSKKQDFRQMMNHTSEKRVQIRETDKQHPHKDPVRAVARAGTTRVLPQKSGNR